MVRLHPNVDFLSEYSSGALSPAQNAAVSAHLHFCGKCRDHVYSLEEIGGWLVEQAEPQAVSESMLDAVMACIDADDESAVSEPAAVNAAVYDDSDLARLPKPVQNLVPQGQAHWRNLSKCLEVAQLPVGETRFELALHKIKAGGRTPEHDHKGMEITVVLQGSFSDDDGVYQEGDFIVREPGDIHTPMATQNDQCICLSVCEAPIRLTGAVSRLLNPFLSFSPA